MGVFEKPERGGVNRAGLYAQLWQTQNLYATDREGKGCMASMQVLTQDIHASRMRIPGLLLLQL